MAISKVIYKSSSSASGVTWMDTTDKTAAANNMLSGVTALGADGQTKTGNIASKSSSDLTASNLTVTAPAGYYASSASKTLSDQNLVAGNVKKDVSIFGVTGTYEGSGGGGGLEYETGTYTPASDIARPTISFSNTHSHIPIFIAMYDVSSSTGLTANSNTVFIFNDVYRVTGTGYPYTETGSTRYAIVLFRYSSGTSQGGNIVQQEFNSDNTDDSSNNYPRYYANESLFKPYSNSNTRYWRSGRTYKWIAVWGPTT